MFAQAERLIRLGLADAAIVGGVDTLCGSVLFGFNSLELVSPEPCRPFDRARRGISLGEAGGFALLERDGEAGPWLLGYGESSDAHHMSSPHPEGYGARLAIQDALARAALTPDAIDYINLHGTASQKNDEVEARLVADLFPARTRASSTKGWTGHTLGAAGIVEAVITFLSAGDGRWCPGTLNAQELDPACGPQIRIAQRIGGRQVRAQQLIRVRRQQLLAAVWPGAACVNGAMSTRTAYVNGVSFWAPRLPGWQVAAPVLRGEAAAPQQPATRPAPTLLGANRAAARAGHRRDCARSGEPRLRERRRGPEDSCPASSRPLMATWPSATT